MVKSHSLCILLLVLLLWTDHGLCWELRDNGRRGLGDKIPPPRSWTLALDQAEATSPPEELTSILDEASLSFGSHRTLVLNQLPSLLADFSQVTSSAGVDVNIEYVEGAGNMPVGQVVDARLYPREQPSPGENTSTREL